MPDAPGAWPSSLATSNLSRRAPLRRCWGTTVSFARWRPRRLGIAPSAAADFQTHRLRPHRLNGVSGARAGVAESAVATPTGLPVCEGKGALRRLRSLGAVLIRGSWSREIGLEGPRTLRLATPHSRRDLVDGDGRPRLALAAPAIHQGSLAPRGLGGARRGSVLRRRSCTSLAHGTPRRSRSTVGTHARLDPVGRARPAWTPIAHRNADAATHPLAAELSDGREVRLERASDLRPHLLWINEPIDRGRGGDWSGWKSAAGTHCLPAGDAPQRRRTHRTGRSRSSRGDSSHAAQLCQSSRRVCGAGGIHSVARRVGEATPIGPSARRHSHSAAVAHVTAVRSALLKTATPPFETRSDPATSRLA
jgi:hypothetical protein